MQNGGVYKVCPFLSILAMLRPFLPIIYVKMFLRFFANWTISDIFHFFSIMCGSNWWFTIPLSGRVGNITFFYEKCGDDPVGRAT